MKKSAPIERQLIDISRNIITDPRYPRWLEENKLTEFLDAWFELALIYKEDDGDPLSSRLMEIYESYSYVLQNIVDDETVSPFDRWLARATLNYLRNQYQILSDQQGYLPIKGSNSEPKMPLLNEPFSKFRAQEIALTQDFELLIKDLTANDSERRWRAAYWLGFSHDILALPHLIAALNDADDNVRIQVVEALGKFQDSSITPSLIPFLEDKSPGVRAYAAEALGKLGNPQALDALINISITDHIRVYELANLALGKIGGPKATTELIDRIRMYPGMMLFISAIESSIASEIDLILPLLSDKNTEIRANIARALGRSHNTKATLPLLVLLNDENKDVRQKAIEALGEIGDEKAIQSLIDVIRSKDPVRAYIPPALAKMGKAALPPLLDLLEDTNEEVRILAAYALGHLGDPSAIDALVRHLHDLPRVVFSAAEALGQLGDKRAIPHLEQLIKSDRQFANLNHILKKLEATED